MNEDLLQLANLGTELGWNEIDANMLGATTYLYGNQPSGFIRNSLDQYAKFFQQGEKRICADKNGKVVPCDSAERVEGGKSGVSLRGIFGLPPIADDAETLCSDCTKEQIEELKKTGDVTSSAGSSLFKIAGFDIDVKALALILIGILLLVVAVNKL